MSTVATPPRLFSFSSLTAPVDTTTTTTAAKPAAPAPVGGAFALPSPPPSNLSTGSDGSEFEFDLDSFTHCSPDPEPIWGKDDPPDLSTPSSTTSASAGISPKSSASVTLGTPQDSTPFGNTSFSFNSNFDNSGFSLSEPLATDAIALSNHHFQRYLHYKALAAQAEEQAAAAASIQNEQIEAFLASISMPEDPKPMDNTGNMMAFQTAPAPMPQQSFYAQMPDYSAPFMSQPAPQPMSVAPTTVPNASTTAAMAHAQARAHMQAHEAVLARAQHQRSLSMSTYPSSTRSSIDNGAVWSRGSVSTQSTTSPPFPSTPNYAATAPAAIAPVHLPPAAPMMAKSMSTTSTGAIPDPNSVPLVPSVPMIPPIPQVVAHVPAPVPIAPAPLMSNSEGENELDSDKEDDIMDTDVKPVISTAGMTNLHGGGRGYIPGKTPDDPKKRHKCQICGRGFARAFNLKSHIQTHNPMRSKPHQCPHPACKRGFSRLHDLERHRQGIHSDGPLVDAKRQGVPPAVARAQNRIQRRAENGSLV